MNYYWGPSEISNPCITTDLRKYFFAEISEDELNNIYASNKESLNLICDRYEFIVKLLDLKQLLNNKKVIQNPKIDNVLVDGKKCLEITHDELVEIDGFEFNGVRFDIEALCQYLLLSLIDTIMGKSPYKTFNDWLLSEKENKEYTMDEILLFEKEYQNEYGLSKNFKKAFSDYLPENIRKRLLNTFILAKLDLGKINDESLRNWEIKTEDEKIKKISDYLYSDVRCKYTHSSSRHFLNVKQIMSHKPTKEKILLNKVDPDEDNLITILQDLIISLVQQKYILNKF